MGIREVRMGTETLTEYLRQLVQQMARNDAAEWAARLVDVIPAVQVLETRELVSNLHADWANHQIDCSDCVDGQCGHGAYLFRLVTEARRELDRLVRRPV